MKLTDGLYNHGVHLVWTELELVARQAGTTGTECISVSKHSSMEDTLCRIYTHCEISLTCIYRYTVLWGQKTTSAVYVAPNNMIRLWLHTVLWGQKTT